MVELQKYFIVTPDNKEGTLTIACGPVVFKDGKILLVMDTKDRKWKIPGGTMRDDESPRETVVRELAEETGLVGDVVDDPFIVAFHAETAEGPRYFQLYHYMVDVKNFDLHLSSEILEAGYFDPNSIPEPSLPNVRLVMERYFRTRP
jgi:ADP-ribose pyrophosphatase YjhB (NUDIX family)